MLTFHIKNAMVGHMDKGDRVIEQKRDEKGRFLPGTAGGPGRLPMVREQLYLERLHTKVTMEDWDEIIDKALEQAREGNWRARNWLSDYCIGKDPQPITIDQRSVKVDISSLSPEQLVAAIELAKLINTTD